MVAAVDEVGRGEYGLLFLSAVVEPARRVLHRVPGHPDAHTLVAHRHERDSDLVRVRGEPLGPGVFEPVGAARPFFTHKPLDTGKNRVALGTPEVARTHLQPGAAHVVGVLIGFGHVTARNHEPGRVRR